MIETPTFRDFVSGAWMMECYNRCKASTRKRMDSALKTQLLPNFGASPLDRISQKIVHLWFDGYSRTAPAGANRTLDVLRQIFNHAIACGYLSANPTRGLRHNPRPKPTRFLTLTEIGRLYAALAAHHGRGSGRQQAEIIRLLLLTGCRKGELVNLRWPEIDGDTLCLMDSKTGPRTVFLNAQAQAILARQPRTGSPYVFPRLGNLSQCRSDELSLWRKVRRAAKIEDVRLHDLRHTFASHAVMQGVPLPMVSRLLGHSQERMTLRYAHVSDKETEAAAERIGCAIATILTEPARDAPSLTPNYTSRRLSSAMKTVNASGLRQSLSKMLDRLEHDGMPILVCRRRAPAAVLVSLKDYRERFIDREAGERRQDVVAQPMRPKFESPTAGTTLDMLRALRS